MKKLFSSVVAVSMTASSLLSQSTILPIAAAEEDLKPVLNVSFDDGTATDSVNGITGELVGSPVFGEGVKGKAIHLVNPNDGDDVADQYVNFGEDEALKLGTDDFTIMFWYKSPADSDYEGSVISNKDWDSGGNDGFCIGDMRQGLTLNFRAKSTSGRKDTGRYPAATDGSWHHVAATFDRDSRMTMYVDGNEVGSTSIADQAGKTIDVGLPLVLGADGKFNFGIEDAWIDELKIYRSILSQDDLASESALFVLEKKLDEYEALIAESDAAQSKKDAFQAVIDTIRENISGDFSIDDLNSWTAQLNRAYNAFLGPEDGVSCFEVISDTHIPGTNDSNAINQRLIDALDDIKRDYPDTSVVLNAGDFAADGYASEMQGYFNIINRYSSDFPFMTALGNHDVRWKTGWQEVYDRYMSLNKQYMGNTKGKVYYDKWYDNNHYIILNSEWDIKDRAYLSVDQLNWLDEKLAESDEKGVPSFIVVHQPLANTYENSTEWSVGEQEQALREILRKHDRIFLFTGHIHDGQGALEVTQDDCGVQIDVPSMRDNDYGDARGSLGFHVTVYEDSVRLDLRDYSANSWVANNSWTFNLDDLTGLSTKVLDVDFDDETANDASGKENNGTVHGNVTYVEDKDGGKAVHIQNSSDVAGLGKTAESYIDFGDAIQFGTEDFTITYSYKGELPAEGDAIISNKDWDSGSNPGFNVGVFGDGNNGMTLNLNTPGHSRLDTGRYVDVNDGEWHEVAAVFDRDGEMALYVDGFKKESRDISSQKDASVDVEGMHLVLGADGNFAYGVTDITIDNLKVYKSALGSGEIESMWNPYTISKTATSITVSWSDYYDGLEPCAILLNGEKAADINRGDTSVTLTGLKKNTTYRIGMLNREIERTGNYRDVMDFDVQTLSEVKLSEVIIDDDADCFTWSEGGANDGGWTAGSQSGTDIESEHYANKAGASVSIDFTGSALNIYGVKAPNHRKFTVAIDGGDPVTLDAYAASRTSGDAVLFSSAAQGIELEEGEHTAVLTILDEYNEAAVAPVYGLSITCIGVFTSEEPAEPEPEPFPGFTIVEDMQTTTGDDLFCVKYNGSWSGGSYYPDSFHDGYEHYAHSGDSFEMKFIGNKVEMWATKASNHGVYTFSIDGEEIGTGSATNSSRVNQQLIYTTPELEYGEHTLKVELVGQSDMAIQLDYLKVYHDELAPASITLNKTEAVLLPEGTLSLEATTAPWNANASKIEWSSSDENVVTVEDGEVTAAAVTSRSTAVITAAVPGTNIKASCTVVVDPTLSVANAYSADAMRLDLSESYDDLYLGSDKDWRGSIWLNDSTSSKVVVSAMSKGLHNVEVKASSFMNENGDLLPADAIQIGWLEEVKANIGRGNSSAPVKDFPEKIAEGGAIDMEADTLRFAWITLSSDENTKPGTYTGTISVTANELGEPIDIAYTLEVIDLVQPDEEATELQLWQHPFSVANYYLGLGSQPSGGISYDRQDDFYFTDAHFDLMRDATLEYVKAGGHDAVANIVEEAWGHQSYYNDPSMVKWTKNADGTFSFDYTWYDAWINFMIECGVLDPANGIGQIKAYSIVPWSNQVTWKDAESGQTTYRSLTPGSDEWKSVWTAFLSDYMEHSKEKGWFDITYISMDERGLSDLEKAVDLIESVTDENGESFKISSALNYGAPEYYDFTDRIDDISINLGNTSKSQTSALGEHRRSLGLKTTFYTCTGDRPSNFMISDPGENYWTIMYSMALGTDGYMRWAYDNFVYDMHGNASYRYWEPGDGWFFYPLERGSEELVNGKSFYSTPRYEMLKAGMRDAAKVKMLLNSDLLTEEEKAELNAAINAMSAPSHSGSYGSAVLSESSRNQVLSSNKAIQTAVANAAKLQAERDDSTEETANKVLLQQAVDYAESKKAEGALEGLNETVKDYFEEKLAAAKAVLADASADQETVNQAWRELTYAIHLLDFTADKTALNELIAEAEAINLNLYEDGDTKTAFINALAHAKEVADSPTALDASITEAAQQLAAAMNGLIPRQNLDTRLLAWLITSVQDTDLSQYIASAVPAFETALQNAQAVLNAPESQEQIDEAVASLNNAWLQLRRKPDEEALKALNAFVEKVDTLDFSFFSAAEAEGIRTFQAQVRTALADENLDQEQANELMEKAEKLNEFIDQRLEHPEEKKDPAEEQKPAETKPDTEKNTAPSAEKNEAKDKVPARSVKTAVSTAFGSIAMACTAAFGALLVLGKKRKQK